VSAATRALGVLEGNTAVYILKIESHCTIRMFSRMGRRVPLYCTAIGKTLLAYAKSEDREAALKGVRLLAFTPKTLTTRAGLHAELERIREQGFALDAEEHEEGIHCIGAPIFDHTGGVVATLSASWPGFRYQREEESAQVEKVKAAALKVSTFLGFIQD
jgi:IclR family KDG regulon transcriptional repressor